MRQNAVMTDLIDTANAIKDPNMKKAEKLTTLRRMLGVSSEVRTRHTTRTVLTWRFG